jgi:hypothetical protein
MAALALRPAAFVAIYKRRRNIFWGICEQTTQMTRSKPAAALSTVCQRCLEVARLRYTAAHILVVQLI